PYITLPPESGGLLDSNPSLDRGRQHTVAVLLGLQLEHIPGGHRNDATSNPCASERLVRLDRESQFAAGRDENDLRLARGGIGEHISAASHARSGGVLLPIKRGKRLS